MRTQREEEGKEAGRPEGRLPECIETPLDASTPTPNPPSPRDTWQSTEDPQRILTGTTAMESQDKGGPDQHKKTNYQWQQGVPGPGSLLA